MLTVHSDITVHHYTGHLLGMRTWNIYLGYLRSSLVAIAQRGLRYLINQHLIQIVMYQIYQREMKSGHAVSYMYPMEYEFYLKKENADKRVKELMANRAPMTFQEPVAYDLDDNGDLVDIYGDVTYNVDELYEVREVVPRDPNKQPEPF
jgi:hypothetical protein